MSQKQIVLGVLVAVGGYMWWKSTQPAPDPADGGPVIDPANPDSIAPDNTVAVSGAVGSCINPINPIFTI